MSEDKTAPDPFGRVPAPNGNAKGTEMSAKVMLGSLDEPTLSVTAQFNPKEIEVAQNVPWSKTNEANKAKSKKNADPNGGIHMEFTGAEGRTVSLELLFDAYETTPEDAKTNDVLKNIEQLQRLASVREQGATTDDKKRPHHCVVVWGNVLSNEVQPRFLCVIQSLNVKYTMFNRAGTPLRATATVKLAEANVVSTQKKKK